MLAIGRKAQETVHIGPDIVVRVASIRGKRVTLMIDAPQAVRVLRGELTDVPADWRRTNKAKGENEQ